MLETISTIFIKYWVEFALGLIAAGGGLFFKRYLQLEKENREKKERERFELLLKDIREENQNVLQSLKSDSIEIKKRSDDRYEEIQTSVRNAMIAGREESKADDEHLQNQISTVNDELGFLKAGMLSMQGKEFRANCRKLLEENHEITLDEWEEIDADHDAYNGLGGNHRGDQLFNLVKKKVENNLTN